MSAESLFIGADSRPRVLHPWMLRNDGDNLVLYKCETSELKYFVLSPPQAILVPFLSGTRTFEQLRAIWLHLRPSSDQQSSLGLLKSVLQHLICSEAVVGLEGLTSPTLRDEELVPVPNLAEYRWPAERTSVPVSVVLSTTNRCPADCQYCYAERAKCTEMSLAELIRVMNELSAQGIRLVDFGGGDPFARSDAMAVFRAMREHDFVFFTSTKSLVSSPAACELRDLEIGLGPTHWPHRDLQISVDSTRKDVAAWLTRVPGYLERAEQSIRNLVAAGLDPRVKCVLTPYNYREVSSYLEHFSRLGVRRFQFVQYGRSYYRHSDDLFLTSQQKHELHNELPELRFRFSELDMTFQDELSAGELVESRSTSWAARALCTGGRAAMYIMPNGDVTLCEQIPHAAQYVVGNVLEEDLRSIWHGGRLLDLIHPARDRFSGSVCFSCDEFDECHHGRGYCYRESLFCYGTIYDAPPTCPKQVRTPPRLI